MEACVCPCGKFVKNFKNSHRMKFLLKIRAIKKDEKKSLKKFSECI